MKMNFSNVDMYDRPILILKKADGTPIGVLGNATDIEVNPNYNELSIMTFSLPASVDGAATPFYNDVTGQKIIELKGIAQFAVSEPEESGDKVNMHKSVKASSLECEFGRKKISLPQSTYKFFDSTNVDGTTLGMIMELMPNWTVGSVASTLRNKYRTFEVSGENLYNFIKGTVQKAYNCIFDFDTLNRVVSVRDADDIPAEKQVYISRDNLARDIKVTERTDDLVTRLDVYGADGVDIREVNPTGSNQIINLDYFMNTNYFSQTLVNKYNAWKTLVNNNRSSFYNYAIQYAMRVSEELAENAKLTDLQGEYTSLENIQAVIIQGISTGQKRQADLDTANANLAAKKREIDAKQTEINNIVAERESTMNAMTAIRNQCAYDKYFTLAERKLLDPYIVDNSIEETSFVASEVQSYTDGAGNTIKNKTVTVTGATIETTTNAAGSTLHSIKGGSINVAGLITGTVISAIFERRSNGKIVLSIYVSNGSYSGTSFPSGCISISGTGSVTKSGTTITCSVTDAYLFFSLNASDYEKKTVAWELYEYGEALLAKMAVPTYSFSVDSANFLSLKQFELFKNELELGERIYIQIGSGRILKPVCTGAKFKYFDRPYLELLFSDTFTANDGESKLIEILDNSISMGKTLSSGKFTYEAWTESGASSELHDFIMSALDTAKNAIMSSTEQAVTWDGAGLRLRRYSNDAHTAYEPEQIWINNNSIMMTDSAWATAKMAIGKIHDENVGDKWGIIAEMLVGTLIAGEELVVESQKKDGGTAVFRMDSDGCRLYNSEFTIQKTNTDGTTTQILLDPSVGVAMGTYPVTNRDGSINTTNAKFYVDPSGTMHLAGSIISYDGIIGGWTISQDGLYSGDTNATRVGMTSSGDIRIWAGNLDKTKAPFYVKQDGTIHSTLGQIGGWYIGTDYIGNASTKATSTTGMASGSAASVWTFWAGGAQASAPFRVNTAGRVYCSNIEIVGGSIVIKDGDNTMFTVTNKGKVTAADITITGGSINIKDGNVTKFQVTNKGKVTINDGSITIKSGDTIMFQVTDQGVLTAKSGTVGGWYIGADYIGNVNTKADSTVGLYKSTGTSDIVIWAGGKQATAVFRVTGGGKVYASNIEATGGKIGNWYIGSDYIGNADTKANSTVGMASGTGTNIVFWAGGEQGSAVFRVNANGKVFASNLEVTGGSISIKSGDTVMFQVTDQGVLTAKSGTVGGWYIGTDYIGNMNKKADSTVGLAASTTDANIVIWAGGKQAAALFRVTAGGKLYASGAEISGDITTGNLQATGGKIGNWYIGSDYIGNADAKTNSTVGMASGTGTNIVFWAGGKQGSAVYRVNANGKVFASNLEVTGGSISIKSGDVEMFKVTDQGVLTAKSGTVGGWYIGTDYIGNMNKKADSTVGLAASTTDANIVIWAGGKQAAALFRVTAGGKLYASGAEISGDVTTGNLQATGGKIGGWFIGTDYIGSANAKATSKTGMASTTTDGQYAFWAGNSGGDPSGANFRVQANGTVYASNLNITGGSIEIKDGGVTKFKVTSTGKVTAADLEITGGSITLGTVFSVNSSGYLTASSGKIGGWFISADHIGNAATKAGSSVGLSNVATGNVFWAGTNKFTVTAAGKVTASDLDITGGSINIKNSAGTVTVSVSNTGKLSATGADISGKVTATELYIGNKTVDSYLDGKGYYLEADHNTWVTTYWDTNFGANGTYTKKTQYLQNNGQISLNAFTEGTSGTALGLIKKAGITVDASGHIKLESLAENVVTDSDLNTTLSTYATIEMVPGKISQLTWDTMGNSSSILMTPSQIKLASTGYLVISSGNFTLDTNGNGTIGGWSFSNVQLNSGSDSGYVALNSNNEWNASVWNPISEQYGDWTQPYAIWCGNGTAGSAPFRVRRDGTVYLNALMVWDGSKYVKVDFSRDFSDAVKLSSGGSWDGDTFKATLKFFNNDSFKKSISISASVSLTSVTVSNASYTAGYGDATVVLKQYVNGISRDWTLTLTGVANALEMYKSGWSSAAACVGRNYNGEKTIVVPAASYGGGEYDTTTYNITKTYDNGWKAAAALFNAPSAGTGTSFSVPGPSSTSGESHSIPFTITKGTPGTSGYAAVSVSGTVVGRIDISDWYTQGVTDGEAKFTSRGSHSWYYSDSQGNFQYAFNGVAYTKTS